MQNEEAIDAVIAMTDKIKIIALKCEATVHSKRFSINKDRIDHI